MGVGKSMKTFFEGMENQFIGGYGPKLVTTPMGPFRWDDNRQLWENVNNGMVLSNISFQDMMFMGYESTSGDNGYSIVIGNTCANAGFTTTQNLGITAGSQGSWRYAPNTRTTTTNTCPFVLYVDAEDISGTLSLEDFTFRYKNTLHNDTASLPDFAPYEDLILGSDGTNITITTGTTFGFGNAGTNQSKFAVAIFFNKYNSEPPTVGNLEFNLKFYNKTTGAVIHTTAVKFDNLDAVPILTPSAFGVLTGITTAGAGQIFWAGTTGPRSDINEATEVSFTDIFPNINIKLEAIRDNAFNTNLTNIYYSLNGSGGITYTTGFTLVDGDTLKIGAKFPPQGALTETNSGRIRVSNTKLSPVTGITLTGVTWSYTIDGLDEPPPEI